MQASVKPPNSAGRVAAVRAHDILDTAEEEIFHYVCRAAAEICSAPAALLNLVDGNRQRLKARIGLAGKDILHELAFSAHMLQERQFVVLEDAAIDPRFPDAPWVGTDAKLRFCAGIPLVSTLGETMGALCVFDDVPRLLSPEQLRDFSVLAVTVVQMLELRNKVGASLFVSAVNLASDGISISIPSPKTPRIIYANKAFSQLTGYTYLETVGQLCSFPASSCPPLPAEPQLIATLHDAQSKGHLVTEELQFLRKDGEIRWVRLSLVPFADEPRSLLYVVAVHCDITAQKEAERQTQQLHAMRTTLASVDHIVKNFMNAAQLFAAQVTRGEIDFATDTNFQAALFSARSQLAAIHGMPAFRERSTSFGTSILDPEPAGSGKEAETTFVVDQPA